MMYFLSRRAILLILVYLFPAWGACVIPIDVDYGYDEQYAVSVSRAVGPTTRTNARGTFPQPAPDDTNSIWVAPNGNNANPGTQASPKLTIATGAGNAVSALNVGGGLANIQLFRNAYVGELLWTETSLIQLPSGASIQVEDGEYAVVRRNGGLIQFLGTGTVNGVWLGGTIAAVTIGGGATFQNCLFTNFDRTMLARPVANPTLNLEASIADSVLLDGDSISLTVDRSILLGISNSPFTHSAASGGTTTIDVDRTLIRTGPGISLLRSTSITAETIDLTISSSDIASGLFARFVRASGVATSTLNLDLSYTRNAAGTAYSETGAVTGAVTLNLSVANAISGALDPQTVDEMGALADLSFTPDSWAYLFSLRKLGKPTPDESGTYPLNSILVGAGDGGVDVNPWTEAVSGPVESFTLTKALNWPPATVDMDTIFLGATTVPTISGGQNRNYDAQSGEWTLNWGDNSQNGIHAQLVAIARDRGPQLWYFASKLGNLFTGIATTGAWDSGTGILTPNFATGVTLEEGQFDGFIMELESPTPDVYVPYWIVETGQTTLSLSKFFSDATDTPVGSGTVAIRVRAWAGYLDPGTIKRAQTRWTSGMRGGSQWFTRTNRATQWKGAAATVKRITNLRTQV